MAKELEIEKFTTLYSGPEDRIRLAGVRADGSAIVLWLTQRLIKRMLPHIVVWLETHDRAGKSPTVQSFRQQAARANHIAQPPVDVGPQETSWLVHSIDVASNPRVLRLIFKDKDAPKAIVPLSAEAARQWLNILHKAHQRAQWPSDYWPSWIHAETLQPDAPQTLPH